MKKPLGRNWPTAILLFAAMFALTISASFYTQSLARERAIFQVIISDPAQPQTARPVFLDLANQGLPKRIAQSNKISLSTGHRGGIVNRGTEPLWLSVATQGFKSQVDINAHDIDFDHTGKRLLRPVAPFRGMTFNVDLTIPREIMGEEQVDSGVIQIYEYKKGQLLAEVPVTIVNTKGANANE